MRIEYVMFRRTSKKNRTLLPKQAQSAKEIKFLVRSGIADKFPKELDLMAMHMADLIIADGIIIKNVLGVTNV